MKEKFFPFQIIGSNWLSNQMHALLADEMGLGKSAQFIRASDIIKAENILIICPAIARINWKREFEKFSTIKREITVHQKTSAKIEVKGVVILSFEAACAIKEINNFCLLGIDERHYLKSIDARRAAAVYGVNGLVRKCKRVWEISGTPAPNGHAGELWSMLYTYGRTPLKYSQFIERYCNVTLTSYGVKILGNKKENLIELQKILDSFMLMRKKEDVMKELPPIFYDHKYIEAGEVDITQQTAFVRYSLNQEGEKELEDKLTSQRLILDSLFKNSDPGDAIKGLEALANSVSTLRMYTGLQKVKAVAEIVSEELKNNAYQKVVIFGIHRDVIEGLRSALRIYQPVTLYGGLDPDKKQSNIDRFQTNPRCRVMIANIHAAGTSVTLTAAHHVQFVEQDWVPGNNAQAVMRVHRIGQTNTVFVRTYALANSFDEKVSMALKRKSESITEIFDLTMLTDMKHDYNNVSHRGEDIKSLTNENAITDLEGLLK